MWKEGDKDATRREVVIRRDGVDIMTVCNGSSMNGSPGSDEKPS
jgi:hypothetical protein